MKNKRMKKTRALFLMMCMAMLLYTTLAFEICNAKEIYKNPDTGYVAVIEDDAALLTPNEIRVFENEMKALTEYGNVCVKTIRKNDMASATDYANDFYDSKFGEISDGTILLIDMDNRELVLTSEGRIKQDVSSSYADSIMDNVYQYASEEKYEICCQVAFEQVHRLLEGKKIAQPMKHICNAFLALIISIILNYCFIKLYARKKKEKNPEFMIHTTEQFDLLNLSVFDKKSYTEPSVFKGGFSGGSSHRSGGSGSSHSSYRSSSRSSYHSSGHSSSHSSRSSSHSSSHSHSSGSHRF